METIKIECFTGGERLDVFLASNIPGLSRSAAQKLLDNGSVSLLGTGTVPLPNKSYITSAGEVYSVSLDEPVELDVAPQDIPLDIIFEDADVIVVNKPRGMVVHPAPGHSDGTLVNALLSHCGDSLSGIGGVRRPGIVHRIDRDTSGLIMVAKNDRAHVALAAQLANRSLTREYDAIVRGVIKNDSGTIDAPIGRHHIDRKRQAVYAIHTMHGGAVRRGDKQRDRKSRNAVTHFEVIERFRGYTYVRCRLETGRTHQIRVHMAYLGHPVLGDLIYGRKKPELGLSGQCLHARLLRFVHPSSKAPMVFISDLPEYFCEVLRKLEGGEKRGGFYVEG